MTEVLSRESRSGVLKKGALMGCFKGGGLWQPTVIGMVLGLWQERICSRCPASPVAKENITESPPAESINNYSSLPKFNLFTAVKFLFFQELSRHLPIWASSSTHLTSHPPPHSLQKEVLQLESCGCQDASLRGTDPIFNVPIFLGLCQPFETKRFLFSSTDDLIGHVGKLRLFAYYEKLLIKSVWVLTYLVEAGLQMQLILNAL